MGTNSSTTESSPSTNVTTSYMPQPIETIQTEHHQQCNSNANENQNEKQEDEMCVKIMQNNRKQSVIRRSHRPLNSSSITVGLHDKIENKENRNSQVDLEYKLKYFSNNKKLVEESIEATVCVQRALNMLCHREILQSNEFRYLNAKNMRSLECKQKRYKNLQAREHKTILQMEQGDEQKVKIKNKHNSFHSAKPNLKMAQTRP